MGKVPLSIRLKVQRAEEHLKYFQDLQAGRVGPIKHNLETLGFHYDSDQKQIEVEATAQTPETEWAIVVGEAIHQLRSSLDHLVCALARRRNPSITDQELMPLGFPLCKSLADFEADKRISKGVLKAAIGMRPLAQVKRSQPYKRTLRGRAADRHPLYVLHKFDNANKHRALIVLGNKMLVRNLPAAGWEGTLREGDKPRTQEFRLTLPKTATPDKVKMEDFSIAVTFNEPLCDRPVASMLRQMISNVEDTIDNFERFF